jgi:hypothetical protein
MALQIAPTPILSGKDSELFNKSLKKGLKKRMSSKEVEEMQNLVKSVLKNATFPV